MKHTLIATIAALALAATAKAQVDNYALSLTADSKVTCGPMTELDGLRSYSLQFFICPDTWTNGAVLVQRGDSFKASLAAEGTISVSVGATSLSASGLTTGTWQQVTLVVDDGAATLLIDGTPSATGTLQAIPACQDQLTLGGGYCGRLDELRIWNAALNPDFNYFINTTLNKWAPQRDNLVAYYKMDQNLCPNIVDYCTVDATPGHHGTMTAGAERTLVTDNEKLPYCTNAAYTYNNRFYDRVVTQDQYLLSNEIIILGANSSSDGHVTPMTPNNHGTLSGGATRMASWEGRDGVLSLDGTGSMATTTQCLAPTVDATTGTTSKGYTFETWLYIDEWVEGAFLFRKENADATQGFSIRLGSEGQIIARCNGNDYVNAGHMKTGEWMHIGITTTAATTLSQTYLFIINGTSGRNSYTSTTLSSQTIDYTPTGMDDIVAVIGEGFKGKLDETAVWNTSFAASAIKDHCNNGTPMPAIGGKIEAATMMCASAYYKYDLADEPGFSSHSQDSWLRVIKSAYDGYRGAHFYLSVNSHTGWTNTITNADKRATFAADLATLSEPYDGVELDLEWAYNSTDYANYGLLAQAIRQALPEGKQFRISCHAVTYSFPKDKMQYVDGFTFQQYGPRITSHTWDNFQTSAQSFESYGFDKQKTLLSWSTTTSGQYDADGNYVNATVVGIKDLDSTLINLDDGDCQLIGLNGKYYYAEGPRQVYNRAAYAVSHGVKGLFYWDMGNDYPTESQYNCAKWASYGLNSNIEKAVTSVNVYTGIDSTTTSDTTQADPNAPAYNVAGQRVADSYKGIVIKNGKKMLRR